MRLSSRVFLPLLVAFAPGAGADALNPDISLVLDGAYKSAETALSEREEGFNLGHTELSLGAAVDDQFYGKLTAVLETHDGETELGLEEAFVQTLALPAGLSVRGGRFLSQVGYLNQQHLHADDFVERPAAYRAFLGSHYYDDGVRLNLLLPTPFFWELGAEAFRGSQLSGAESDEDIGVYTVTSKIGGDIGRSQSWQLGVGYLGNRLIGESHHEEEHGEEHEEHEGHEHEAEHDHSHGAAYTGENVYMADLVWKWAPGGNNRERQLTLAGEYIRVTDITDEVAGDDYHEGWYASAVYRFLPQWKVGVRYGEVELKEQHGDHFHDQNLAESSLMLAWQHSHFSTLRLEYSHQDADGFETADNAVTLQYVMTLGAHDAHAF